MEIRGKKKRKENIRKKDKKMRGPVQGVQNPNNIFQKREQRILREINNQISN